MASHKQQFIVRFGYHGSRFHGVAPQPATRTAGGALLARMQRVTQQTPHAISLAARTDAGVSADANLLSFRLADPTDAHAVVRALELPSDDGLFRVQAALLPRRVLARSLVCAKHYSYRLAGPQAPSLGDAWQLAVPLCPTRLHHALQTFCGTHDFSAFCHGTGASNPIRTIHRINLKTIAPATWAIDIHGVSFLRRMIRIMVCAAAEAACGLRPVRSIAPLLANPGAPRAAASAPACGLTLKALTVHPAFAAMIAQALPTQACSSTLPP